MAESSSTITATVAEGGGVAGAAGGGIPKTTPLILLWAFSTLFWSIFTPPTKTFAARTILFQPLWLLRAFWFRDDATWVQDLAIFLVVHAAYGLRTGAWNPLTVAEVRGWLDLSDAAVRVYVQVFAMLGGCAVLAGSIVYRGARLESRVRGEGSSTVVPPPPPPASSSTAATTTLLPTQKIDESLLDPLLIPSRTTHSRLFPEKHAFSYSYLLVGIPIGFQGRLGNVLSVDSRRSAWFDVKSADYLNRGEVAAGLGEKLKRFLYSQDVTDGDYSFAYLVTAPRFLGYSFNPVSFWYIYDSDAKLKYMVLEVNNTFDERRMYLLRADGNKPDDSSSDPPRQTPGEPEPSQNTLVFSDTFAKDFHVSPFNSRKGSYSLRAVDPLAAFQESGQVKIDNTIVLRSSKASPKIVARIWSEGPPKDPSAVTPSQLLKFILSWWWVGLLTFPRIVWEAQKLFFRKKLHVWFRPEVATGSIGRTYTDDEVLLESFFNGFLTHVVEHARKPLRVIYEPAQNQDGGSGEETVLYSPGFAFDDEAKQLRTLSVKVISPAFYSRFVHYAHAREAFDRECLATDDRNRTVLLGSAEVLPHFFDAMEEAERFCEVRTSVFFTPLERVRWDLLRRLRCPPAAASYPSDSSRLDYEFAVEDIRAFKLSEMDRFVRSHREDSGAYRRTVAKLFVAERLGLGFPPLVAVGDVLLRSIVLLFAMGFCDRMGVFDVLRPRSFEKGDVVPGGFALLLANGVHIWSVFKG